MALLRVLVGADRAAAPAADRSTTPGTGGSTATTSTSRTRRGTRSCPAALYVGLLWMAALAAVAMTVGFRAACRDDHRLASSSRTTCSCRRRTSTTTAPTSSSSSPRSPSRRATGSCRSTPGCARRRGARRAPTTSPGWPLWLLRFEAATVYGASGLSKLLDPDWFSGDRHVAPPRAHAPPARRVGPAAVVGRPARRTARSTPSSAKFVIATELFIAARPVVAPHALRRGLGRRVLPRRHPALGVGRGVLVPRHRRPRDLGRAVDPRPHAARRPGPATGASPRVVRALDWLARFRIERGAAGVAAHASSTATAASHRRARRRDRRSAACPPWHGSPCPLVAAGHLDPPKETDPVTARPRRAAPAAHGHDARRRRRSSRSASLAPPEHCPQPTAESLHQAADDAVQWFVRNQQRRRPLALRVRRRPPGRARRLQPRAPRRRDHGPLPGGHGRHRRRPRERRPRPGVGAGQPRRARRVDGAGVGRPGARRRRRRCSPPGSPSAGC